MSNKQFSADLEGTRVTVRVEQKENRGRNLEWSTENQISKPWRFDLVAPVARIINQSQAVRYFIHSILRIWHTIYFGESYGDLRLNIWSDRHISVDFAYGWPCTQHLIRK